MKHDSIKYRINAAAIGDVFSHLSHCGDSFEPPLRQRVDVREYSGKLVEQSITFEAWQDRELVGLVAAYINDEQKKSAFITNVSVLKDHLGNGIAFELVENCVRYAAAQGFSKVELEVGAGNKPAIGLYEKLKFTASDERADVIRMKYDLNGEL